MRVHLTRVWIAALAVLAACGHQDPIQGGAAFGVEQAADTNALPNWMCTVGSFDDNDVGEVSEGDDLVRSQLAPTGLLRVGINYGNVNNATVKTVTLPDGTMTKKLSGVAVDLACRLAARLGVPLVFAGNVPGTPGYSGIPPQTADFVAGKFDVGFSADPILRSEGTISAHSHIWVENHFLVPDSSPFVDGALAELDLPGVKISSGNNNSPDIFLKANLQNATVVDTNPTTGAPLTVPQAITLLTSGQVDAFAGSVSVELPQTTSGAFRILPTMFLMVHVGMFVATDHLEAQHYLSVFVEWAKEKGYIADAIVAAGLDGVQVPLPEKVGGVGR